MNALATHVWGNSAAADRVWSSVAGLRPSLLGGRLLMVLQAYIDESVDPDANGDWFVLGGYIATPEQWASFSCLWERLLPTHGVLSANGQYHFKMSEMAMNPERLDRVQAFYRVIEEFVQSSISVAFRKDDLRIAQTSIVVPKYPNGINWGLHANPYRFGFTVLMDMFHSHREQPVISELIPPHEKIDFYFDDRIEKGAILSGWDSYLSLRPDIRRHYGATPRFEDDREFLPLQAADFWAWWVRRWSAATPGIDIRERRFPWSVSEKRPSVVGITATREQMLEHMLKIVRSVPGGEDAYLVT